MQDILDIIGKMAIALSAGLLAAHFPKNPSNTKNGTTNEPNASSYKDGRDSIPSSRINLGGALYNGDHHEENQDRALYDRKHFKYGYYFLRIASIVALSLIIGNTVRGILGFALT